MAKYKISLRNKIIAATPLVCLFAFLLIGFLWDKWHPGWMVFLLIPVMPYLVGKRKIRLSIPLIAVIIYLILGFGWNLWHPGWLIFLLVPVFEIFFGAHPFDKKGDDDDDDDDDKKEGYIDTEEAK